MMHLNNKTTVAAVIACIATSVTSITSATAQDSPAPSEDARCIHQELPIEFVRIWDLELGQTSLSKVGGLPSDDKNWFKIGLNDQSTRTGVTNSVGDLLITDLFDSLEAMGENSGADAYLCPDGIQWYSVNAFDGCEAKQGTSLTLKDKTYANTETSWLQSIRATVSYVCTHEARRKDIGVSYTAVVSNNACLGPVH